MTVTYSHSFYLASKICGLSWTIERSGAVISYLCRRVIPDEGKHLMRLCYLKRIINLLGLRIIRVKTIQSVEFLSFAYVLTTQRWRNFVSVFERTIDNFWARFIQIIARSRSVRETLCRIERIGDSELWWATKVSHILRMKRKAYGHYAIFRSRYANYILPLEKVLQPTV